MSISVDGCILLSISVLMVETRIVLDAIVAREVIEAHLLPVACGLAEEREGTVSKEPGEGV